MQAEKRSTEPAGFEALCEQIQEWRSMRPRPRSMPEPLWNEAVSMARELGVYRVARALRLNLDTLKRRAGPTSTPGRRGRGVVRAPLVPARTDFVEVKGLGQVSSAAVGHETVVEVLACDGARLSIRLKCASTDVAALICAFRGDR